MTGIFTLHHTSESSMEPISKKKGSLGLKQSFDTLVKPQNIELSKAPCSSSIFTHLFKQPNQRYFLLFILALFSRFLVWTVAFASNYFIADYDSSVDLILPNISAKNFLQVLLKRTMASFVRWDAFYFVHIAEEGYVYEQEYAFFPMLPLLMRGLSDTVLKPLHFLLERKLVLVLSGVIISNVAFALAAVALYHLSYSIFKKEKFARISALCFCITPSCMFMSSMYTESLFALFTFVGMDLYVHQRLWSAAVVWSFSSATRSNGITYAGFFIFDLCIKNRSKSLKIYATQVVKAIGLSLVTVLGMVSFQVYGYVNYCVKQSGSRPWCEARIPMIYSFVQEEYWNCGLFRYYEWKQIPNFLLAAPMVILSITGIWSYAAHDWSRFFSVGISTSTVFNKSVQSPISKEVAYVAKTTIGPNCIRRPIKARPVMISPIRYISTSSRKTQVHTHSPKIATMEELFYTDTLLPFIYLWGVLLVYCTLAMHIQVITRFFSSMPTVYWFAAHVLVQDTEASKQKEIATRTILFYFMTYGLTGIVLFSNFFPPA